MGVSIIPDVVREQTIHSLGESESAHRAAQMMAEHDISAVVVVDREGLFRGIVTERDITRRVAAADRVPHETKLSEIMTTDVETVAPHDSPFYALRLMIDRRYRHLPVVAERRVVGMVSLRDLRLLSSVMAQPKKRSLRAVLGLSGQCAPR